MLQPEVDASLDTTSGEMDMSGSLTERGRKKKKKSKKIKKVKRKVSPDFTAQELQEEQPLERA